MENLKIIVCFLILIASACKSAGDDNEKYQRERDNVINVAEKIVDVDTKIPVGPSQLYIIDRFLIINEIIPQGDKGIHLFDKNTFEYITSTGFQGRGPGEITRPGGSIAIDYSKNSFHVVDHGRRGVWEFSLNGILNDENYKPTKFKEMDPEMYPERFEFVNDSIALGMAIRPLSIDTYERVMVKLNLNTNTVNEFGYVHPEAVGEEVAHARFAVCVDNGVYVKSYIRLDLITICDLEGNLKYNVYGPGWSNDDNFRYFGHTSIINDKIIASYTGGERAVFENNRRVSNFPSQFLVFDLEGNYKYTIETGYRFISHSVVDEENGRMICYFDGRENRVF